MIFYLTPVAVQTGCGTPDDSYISHSHADCDVDLRLLNNSLPHNYENASNCGSMAHLSNEKVGEFKCLSHTRV